MLTDKPFITAADLDEYFDRKKKTAKPDNAPSIRFDAPPVGTKEIVNSVCFNKGGWKTLQQVADETAEAKRARKFSEKYDFVPIPEPEWEDEDL